MRKGAHSGEVPNQRKGRENIRLVFGADRLPSLAAAALIRSTESERPSAKYGGCRVGRREIDLLNERQAASPSLKLCLPPLPLISESAFRLKGGSSLPFAQLNPLKIEGFVDKKFITFANCKF